MSVSMHPSRRLRIVGKPGDTHPQQIQVHDADTGEPISNIHHIDLTLDAKEKIRANVTYYMVNAAGQTLVAYQDNEPYPDERTVTTEVVEIDVTAIEDIED